MNTPRFFFVPNCPDFYFMPSMRYDQFLLWDHPTMFWKSAQYWQDKGWPTVELQPCEESEATCWIVTAPHWRIQDVYVVADKQSAEAARHCGKTVAPYTLIP